MAYSLLGETFGEYAVAMSFLLLRFYARIKIAGIRNLGLGDIFAGMAIVGGHSLELRHTVDLLSDMIS